METKQYKKLGEVLIYVVVIVELIIIGMLVLDNGGSNSSIQETDIIWVEFDVSGTIRVEVDDTNDGEVPDEVREEARRVLGDIENYVALCLAVNDYGHYTEVITP